MTTPQDDGQRKETITSPSSSKNKPTITDRQFIIVGAGPAGLTAAYELVRNGESPIVFESSDKVGGISRTENYKGYYFDMGGHRFFSKIPEVTQMWQEVLGEDFLLRPRLSRIYYNGKFFHYPLKPVNALIGLGLWQSIQVATSYLRWQIFPHPNELTFEQWVTNRFGKRLFNIFFKSYTEKVWGIPTSQISADWAAQRIHNLDLKVAILNMFYKPKNGSNTVKTLIEEFHYPRHGPGMMWAAFQQAVQAKGGQVKLNHPVVRIERDGQHILRVVTNNEGIEHSYSGSDFISSMAITDFLNLLDPPPPHEVLEAAKKLTYRNFLTVCLIIDRANLFADNWIYVHDPNVQVGRIQNFKNWSPEMVPDPTKTSLGLEYFCNADDELWKMTDAELIELGRREIEQIGLARYHQVLDGCVFRVEKSYPVWDMDYEQHLAVIRQFINSLENFQTIGRNGLHRYNNQDHSMETGRLAVRNVLFNEKNDLWLVNTEMEYHEEIHSQEKAKLLEPDMPSVTEQAFAKTFLKLDPLAFSLAWGIVLGLGLCLITLIVWNRVSSSYEMQTVAGFLWLLDQYLPGYAVDVPGSLLGLVYGFLVGVIWGGGFALFKNLAVMFTVAFIRRRAELRLLLKLIES
jgi:protoporphyrinogen oxidase